MIEILHGLRKHAATVPSQAMTDDVLQHQRLAEKHGLLTVRAPGATNTLIEVLKEEGIRVYDTRSVEAYLDRKAHGRGPTLRLKTWNWFPLRPRDREALTARDNRRREKRSRFQWTESMGTFAPDIYWEILPLPVLMTVDRIVERLGDEVSFYVAAIVDVPDPFLAVRMKADPDTLLVIERWDEPGFREGR